MRIAGIDGYTGGWIAVILEGGVFATARVAWNKCLETLIRDNKIDHAIVDIPIGLASKPEERDTDQAMRDFLAENEGQGWLATRVFNAPCYQALDAENYAQANTINRDILGVGLTQQTFGIMPKIKEAKKVVKNLGQDRIREGHPEISFYILSNHEPLDSKAKARGAVQRLKLLKDLKFDIINLIEQIPAKHPAKLDDLLDAAVLAWSANRWKDKKLQHESFPSTPKKDSKNLEMVVYA
ncbi:MAG: DUF429 domain-containing protein [Proteobacteria bacterium]|nr:DUF429 domain-containing protein [Pseudomonadota bacterium]